MEETSEYNSDSGDDLPNLNEKSDQKDGLSDKNIPIVIVISTTYLSLRNGMN
ncbi:4187_t:CDS:2 [Paraglomus brasilianum]|uniref:4187_t:CDS:1 n=1 Tax=Paraglomus brasilianum TaxID=144538 RepID=A0A9N9APV0_9GLOM|nr:4187_t:CDS:2 [Paraglomus brasilianum]